MDGNVMNRTILLSILLGSLCGIILGAPSSHLTAPRSQSSSPTIRSDPITLPRSSKTRQSAPAASPSITTRRERQRGPNSAVPLSRNNLKNSNSGGKVVPVSSQIPPRPPRRIHAVIPQPTDGLTSGYNNYHNKYNNEFSTPPQQQQQQQQPSQLEHRQLESQEQISSQRIYQDQSQSGQISSLEDMNNSNNNNNNDNDSNLDEPVQNINDNIPYNNLNEQTDNINPDNSEFQQSSPVVSSYPVGGDQLQLQHQFNQPGAIMSFQNYAGQQQQQLHGNDLRYGDLPTISFVDQAQHFHPLPPFPQERVDVPQSGTFSIPLSPSPNTFTTIFKPTTSSQNNINNNNKISNKLNKNNNYRVNPAVPQISVTSHDSNLDNNNNNSTTSLTGNSTTGSPPQRRIHIDIVF